MPDIYFHAMILLFLNYSLYNSNFVIPREGAHTTSLSKFNETHLAASQSEFYSHFSVRVGVQRYKSYKHKYFKYQNLLKPEAY